MIINHPLVSIHQHRFCLQLNNALTVLSFERTDNNFCPQVFAAGVHCTVLAFGNELSVAENYTVLYQ
jgi:hypothetical protein